jgi:penicillin-binding protein 2
MIPRSRKRLLGLYAVTLAMLVVLGGRLWYLQVLDTTQYKSLAQVNQTRSIVVPAVRGMITDDTGQALVTNQTSMTVSVNMMQLSQTTSDNGKAVLARLWRRRSGSARAASPSPAGPDRLTSRSRSRST